MDVPAVLGEFCLCAEGICYFLFIYIWDYLFSGFTDDYACNQDPYTYMGIVSVAAMGYKYQRWDVTYPHVNSHGIVYFLD